jgi:hypothetical protein
MESGRHGDGSRRSGLTARGVVFLLLLVPVWGIGVVRGERITAHIGQAKRFFGEDLARFEPLRPHLAGVDRAFLLLDRSHGLSAGERFFPAQYVLAPTVLRLAVGVGSVVGPGWSGEPLTIVCALEDPAGQAAALAAIEAAARRLGSPFDARRLDSRLALVRVGRSARR